MFFIEPVRNWYARFERPISSLSLVLGFIFDAVTLKRVDTLWENLWILGHLLVVAVFMILIHLQEDEAGSEANPGKIHFWYVNILQFSFGGILSTYLVFYFRSTDILSTWPFLLLLAIAFIANESMKRHYIRLSFQISLLFLSIYSFAIFLLPVLMHSIGVWVFLASGIVSLAAIALFIMILFYLTKDKFKESRKMILILIFGIFTLINFFYFTNLIPPIPLSLKDGGVYHSIQKKDNGNYDVTYEDYGWFGYFKLYPEFTEVAGNPVYAFSAIFSPKNLDTTIIHEWEHYDDEEGWLTKSTINLPVVGGRDNGFRTYSVRSNLQAGKWRVNIKNIRGQIIGRIRFNIVTSDTEPQLNAKTI